MATNFLSNQEIALANVGVTPEQVIELNGMEDDQRLEKIQAYIDKLPPIKKNLASAVNIASLNAALGTTYSVTPAALQRPALTDLQKTTLISKGIKDVSKHDEIRALDDTARPAHIQQLVYGLDVAPTSSQNIVGRTIVGERTGVTALNEQFPGAPGADSIRLDTLTDDQKAAMREIPITPEEIDVIRKDNNPNTQSGRLQNFINKASSPVNKSKVSKLNAAFQFRNPLTRKELEPDQITALSNAGITPEQQKEIRALDDTERPAALQSMIYNSAIAPDSTQVTDLDAKFSGGVVGTIIADTLTAAEKKAMIAIKMDSGDMNAVRSEPDSDQKRVLLQLAIEKKEPATTAAEVAALNTAFNLTGNDVLTRAPLSQAQIAAMTAAGMNEAQMAAIQAEEHATRPTKLQEYVTAQNKGTGTATSFTGTDVSSEALRQLNSAFPGGNPPINNCDAAGKTLTGSGAVAEGSFYASNDVEKTSVVDLLRKDLPMKGRLFTENSYGGRLSFKNTEVRECKNRQTGRSFATKQEEISVEYKPHRGKGAEGKLVVNGTTGEIRVEGKTRDSKGRNAYDLVNRSPSEMRACVAAGIKLYQKYNEKSLALEYMSQPGNERMTIHQAKIAIKTGVRPGVLGQTLGLVENKFTNPKGPVPKNFHKEALNLVYDVSQIKNGAQRREVIRACANAVPPIKIDYKGNNQLKDLDARAGRGDALDRVMSRLGKTYISRTIVGLGSLLLVAANKLTLNKLFQGASLGTKLPALGIVRAADFTKFGARKEKTIISNDREKTTFKAGQRLA